MPIFTYFYENRMFTKKVRCSIIWVEKERIELLQLKVNLLQEFGRGALRGALEKILRSQSK